MQLGTKQIDYLNIGLMLASCLLAYVLPFELFLFSYAVLGPLHYLTEISWLHKRNYFAKGKYGYIILSALCLVAVALLFVPRLKSWNAAVISTALATAIALVVWERLLPKVLFVTGVALGAVLLINVTIYHVLFSVMLPTMIHVYIFTGLFLIHGALKNRATSGAIAVVTFLGCALLILLHRPAAASLDVGEYVRTGFLPFAEVNRNLAALFGFTDVSIREDVFITQSGVTITRLIAFAYTYHYLNWFSKTSIIKWHHVSRDRLWRILILWGVFVICYSVDYRFGFILLLFLSLLHVFLEFPLNYQTLLGIRKELRGARS